MIVKVEKTSNYTVMSNAHLKDRSLTMKAKGLLSIVLSLPDNWEYSIAGLAALSTEKESAVKTALNELKEHGYLVVTKRMPNDTKSGRIEYEYTFFENPQNAKQGAEKQGLEILPLEILSVENQGQLNTNISNTNILNTNSNSLSPITPKLADKEEKLKVLFDEFWAAYPRKENKKKAFSYFKNIKHIEQILPDIMADLEIKKRSEQWNKNGGQYIPLPTTYLNGERWNDENEIATMDKEIGEAVSDEYNSFFN